MATPWFLYHVNKGYGSYGGKFHDGWDFGAPSHTPLTSLTGGVVTRHTGWYPWGGEIDIKGGALGSGTTETFAHADRIDVKPGDTVWPGAQVGLSGGENLPPQYSTGPHVHYSLFGGAPWDNSKAIDPSSWLNKVRGSGLGGAGLDAGDSLAAVIGEAYGKAEYAVKNTVKRAGYFILGLLLLGVGIFLIYSRALGAIGQKVAPQAAKVAKLAAL